MSYIGLPDIRHTTYHIRIAVLPLVIGADSPILRKKTKNVPGVTKKLLELARDMADTMHAEGGIGIAAPQVGKSERLCLAIVAGRLLTLVNPKITSKSKEMVTDEEGCLSLPGDLVMVPRARAITVTYLDEKGKTQERRLEDFDARVVQHEVDHLDGILIVDYR